MVFPHSCAAAVTYGNNGGSTSGTNSTSQATQDIQQTEADRAFLTQVFDLNSPLNSTYLPLFLHSNDNPGIVLISKKLIGTGNYASWKRSIQIALSVKNKLVIVTKNYPKPEPTSSLFPHWERVNDMCISWILNTMSPEIGDSMNYVTTASQIWKELQDRFSSIDGHMIYQLERDLHTLEQGEKSVEIYFHKLKGYWDEYAAYWNL